MNRPLPRQDRTEIRLARGRGFTLIEMVAVVGLVSLVMTSVAVTISSLHRVNTKLRDEFPASAAVAELGLRLRSDVHAARQATLAAGDDGQALLRMTLADQRLVEYSAIQERVLRIVRSGDQVERRESFSLLRGSELEWTVNTDSIPLVTLTIRCHVGRAPGAADDLRATTMMTAVGLDYAVRP